PASVLDIASASHASCRDASGMASMTGSNSSTAGTLLTRFDSAADAALNGPTGSPCSHAQSATPQVRTTWTSNARTTTNSPANITRSPQSTSLKIASGF